jgi:predicted phosphodiesterase
MIPKTRTEPTSHVKLGVISDIHANLSALEAVIQDARRHGVGRVVCLGDIVGYGPQPAECVRVVQQVAATVVMGNHDAWAVRPVAWSRLAVSPTVIPGLKHARTKLSSAERAWLRQLPLVACTDGVSLVHGSFHRPALWPYLDDAFTALASLSRQPSQMSFFGHTHEAGYWQEGRDQFITPALNREIRLRRDCRYALNPGSVGNPRTPSHRADPRAQYLLFDTVTLGVTFRRVAYDITACASALRAADLPEEMISRVELGY